MGKLFEKITHKDVILASYHQIKEKWHDPILGRYRQGASGIDGMDLREFDRSLDEQIERCQHFLQNPQLDFHPQILTRIPKETPGKYRDLYLLSMRDKLVQRVIADTIEEEINRFYYPNLFSFRKGKYYGMIPAVRKVRKFLENHGGRAFVFKSDISDYYDSIDQTLMLKKFQQLIPDEPEILRIIKIFLRQRRLVDGVIHSPTIGIPTGSSLSPLCANVFLIDLDQEMFRNGFHYLRFCDDVLLMATDLATIKKGQETMERVLAQHHLKMSEKKTELYHPGEAFEYLGYKFEGTKIHVGKVNMEKFRQWVNDLLPRNRYRGFPNKTVEERRELLAIILNDLYNGTFKPHKERQLNWIRSFKMVNDESSFKEMDRYIKNRIRIMITRKASNKNFKMVPERWFRQLGFKSLTGAFYRLNHRRSLMPYRRLRPYIGESFDALQGVKEKKTPLKRKLTNLKNTIKFAKKAFDGELEL